MTHALPVSPAAIVVRDADAADMPAIAAIYAPYVLQGWATFEEMPPTAADLETRWHNVLALGLPYLVAERAGEILGYCYATSYRPRPAYRHTVEDSVYVAPQAHGQGVGRLLLERLVERCTLGGWRQMIAVIGDSANAGSIGLHRSLGFVPAGTLKSVGFKLGRWVDTVQMQLTLGEGDSQPPSRAAS